MKVLERRRLLGKLGGYDRPELDDRIGLLALPTPSSNDDPRFVQSELGSIEEEHLAHLRFEGIGAERRPGTRSGALMEGELELDTVGVAYEVK